MLKRLKEAYKIAKEMEKKEIAPYQLIPSWKNNKPTWSDWSTENAVKHGYKASTWVYSCISRISKTASSVPWVVMRKNSEGAWEEVDDHPLKRLIEQPNPYMSGQDLVERMVTHLYLGGNALLSKIRANNIVAELWPISPDNIKPIVSKTEFISEYEYKDGENKQRINSADIIHFMFIDPSNMYWGLAPLQAVARAVDTDVEMLDWQKVSLQNRAITDGVFSFSEPLTIEQWEDARRMVREQHQGSGNARTPWVLGGGATWQQMSLSPAEMDFISSRQMTREEIASVFNVPPPMIGLYENATLANIETARKIFWVDTMIPLLNDIKTSFNLALTKEFGQDIRLDYDVSNVESMQENFNEKVNTARTLWQMGVPFNQINQKLELGFDELPHGDMALLPMNLMPANMSSPEDEDDTEREWGQASYQPRRQFKSVCRCGGVVEPIDYSIDLATIPRVKSWNLQTEEQKTMYWKNIDRRRRGWEGQFSRRMRGLFNDEMDEIVEAYQNGGNLNGALQVVEQREDAWMNNFRALYTAIIEDFGEETFEGFKSNLGPSEVKQEFNPFDDFIQSWVRRMSARQVRNVLDTTRKTIRNVVSQGMSEGLGVREIAKNMRSQYSQMSRVRAERIARTETASASNFGSYASARQTGLEPIKVWVSSRDDRVRSSHMAVDGQQVGIDDYFEVDGMAMLFPGDTTVGDASELVNCRCTLSYTTRQVVNDELV